MNNENIFDGQNRCKRCNRPLSDPTANYGWRCAQLLGLATPSLFYKTLDNKSSSLYNDDKMNYEKASFVSALKDKLSSAIDAVLPTTSREDASAIITRNKDAIKNAGAYYGVNPAIIAACTFTEQITNVNAFDSMTDVPLYSADTSIGIGQVKVSTAKMLEDNGYIQKTEYSHSFSAVSGHIPYEVQVWYAPAYGYVTGSREKAIAHRLTVESENINYVAAYLRYFQDRWKDVYPEIDGRTAILATLYNQDELFLPHNNPQPNDFGIDAKNEYYYMRQLLESDKE